MTEGDNPFESAPGQFTGLGRFVWRMFGFGIVVGLVAGGAAAAFGAWLLLWMIGYTLG